MKSWETVVEPRKEPIKFSLNGQPFVCLDEIPAGAFRQLSSWATTVGAALRFIEACLIDDETVMRFREVTSDRLRVVPKETILEIMNWLTEEYAERPTPSPSDSASGSKSQSGGSGGDSSRAARRARSTS